MTEISGSVLPSIRAYFTSLHLTFTSSHLTLKVQVVAYLAYSLQAQSRRKDPVLAARCLWQ